MKLRLTTFLAVLLLSYGVSFSADDSGKKGLLAVFPNPVKLGTELQAEYEMSSDGELVVYLTEIDGTIIFLYNESFQKGKNSIILNTAGFPPGKYILKFNADGTDFEETVEFVK